MTRPRERGWGMVHGRFQPFHRGHLEYLLAAAARCERLLVGITNPDRVHTAPEPADPTRHLPEANPFSYTERLLMIEAAAAEAGVRPPAIIPFPVSEPAVWPDYVPAGTVHYLRVLSPWGTAKAERLRAAGHEVVLLDPGPGAAVSGTAVRAAMRDGGDWARLVPPAVARVIRELRGERALDPRPAA